MVTDRMNRVCAVLTGAAMKVRKEEDPGIFVAGMDSNEKLHVTAVVIGIRASNRHQMGILVNALREQSVQTPYSTVAAPLRVQPDRSLPRGFEEIDRRGFVLGLRGLGWCVGGDAPMHTCSEGRSGHHRQTGPDVRSAIRQWQTDTSAKA